MDDAEADKDFAFRVLITFVGLFVVVGIISLSWPALTQHPLQTFLWVVGSTVTIALAFGLLWLSAIGTYIVQRRWNERKGRK